MRAIFQGKKITGILSVLPENEVFFEDEVENYNFPSQQTMRLKKIMGYEKHRISKSTSASSDLCVFGLNDLLRKELILKEDIGAIIVVTITPDHFVPHVSNIVQGKCELPLDVLCMDISQGCTGFLLGLMQAFLLLDIMPNKKVLLMNVDVLSQKVSKQDRNSYPLIGDAATITIVENDRLARDIYFNLYMDGTRGDSLIIPAGGSRLACSEQTVQMQDDGDGNLRCLDNLKMDGTSVFNFVQTDVPPMLCETLDYAGLKKEDIDWYLFHQPNKFMLQKLAERIGIPREKVFMNIVENYGNTSGATIPMAIVHNLSNELLSNKRLCCLSAFGAGLSWGAMTMELGDLDFCETIISNF
ncbi:3-oxoacyl-ACP synthase III family protein [Cohnella sp.]|uniref:3-oxoacyl-ACP synthase III family protein n=1 Tax=Cohnella sp. TaxID=1883426 RepID=UPI0037039381